ncbi:hypothetical protein [Acinetobacter sp. ANC 4648]|uniref:hypothetical protein n=1 Tax=Acinetobacter sp. ANC 4648 TaxID=1977875 RepID=UPI000A32C039|nr:hypothetical protein [Acinetobacter sp. ANC 4648]OTG81650.1 hypothetical protein B9T27_10285 [Acinetobacter sp. ANC 4648]
MKIVAACLCTILGFNAQSIFAETKVIECQLNVSVIASQKYAAPVHQYTTLKNDGSPMLLIGIHIQKSKAIHQSENIKTHQAYCRNLVGQQKDAYLSGYVPLGIIHLNDQLTLSYRHTSAKHYPFWPEAYSVIKR